ncbi:uncharacterized protein LOC116219901 [Clupea harengus]|uniref:Uncharacterized protein LOC116219901 n=1 Tax=Clupea harengus TaxID=7950 RepID=A0A6P8F9Q4_CLUHA|nr:uncharacterized protein LOC116219901 [Clupea harengus]
MSCKITSQDEPSISMFAWISPGRATLCELDENGGVVVSDSAVSCTYRDKQLDLTIRHTKPIHEGRYICKLRSNLGGKHSYTQLKLQECHNQLHYHILDGNVTCGARGVYPEAHIHWFQGPQNLTHSSVSHPSIPAEDGTFEVASTLPHQHQSALNCSLWSPSTGRLLSSIQMSPPASPPQSRDTFSRATSFGAVGTTVTLFAVALILL